METIPEINQQFTANNLTVRVTRVTAISGNYRWVYYRNLDTDEFHCQRLDLFLKFYS